MFSIHWATAVGHWPLAIGPAAGAAGRSGAVAQYSERSAIPMELNNKLRPKYREDSSVFVFSSYCSRGRGEWVECFPPTMGCWDYSVIQRNRESLGLRETGGGGILLRCVL